MFIFLSCLSMVERTRRRRTAKGCSQEADLERALKLNPQRRHPLRGGRLAGVTVAAHALSLWMWKAAPQEPKHPLLKALPGRGISRWTYGTGVAFKKLREWLFWTSTGENTDGSGEMYFAGGWGSTATRFTGNILIVKECLDKEHVLISKTFWCSSLQVKLNNHSTG